MSCHSNRCVGPIEACIFRVIIHLHIHKVILVQFIFIAIVTIIYDYKHNCVFRCVCLYAVIAIKKNILPLVPDFDLGRILDNFMVYKEDFFIPILFWCFIIESTMDGFDGGSEKVKNGGGGGRHPNGGGGDSGGGGVNEALRKCLKENKGDYEKCKPKIEALKSFPTTSSKKPITPLRLRSGSLTDV
ncbi:hypothetical protein L2E82_45858 [Cichorium intybus]|uniref:Uncharacterized protein n=1 Tax=Cichorium intybus TaxID=13427 RepID=A0ACB8ZU34_CICIN|nr:hypothetical protein L2E82_45858 [Cichorium intybus]